MISGVSDSTAVTTWQGIPFEVISGKTVLDKQRFVDLLESIYKAGTDLYLGKYVDSKRVSLFIPGDPVNSPCKGEDAIFHPSQGSFVTYFGVDKRPVVVQNGSLLIAYALAQRFRGVESRINKIFRNMNLTYLQLFKTPIGRQDAWQTLQDRMKFAHKIYDAMICLKGLNESNRSCFRRLNSCYRFFFSCMSTARLSYQVPEFKGGFTKFGDIKIFGKDQKVVAMVSKEAITSGQKQDVFTIGIMDQNEESIFGRIEFQRYWKNEEGSLITENDKVSLGSRLTRDALRCKIILHICDHVVKDALVRIVQEVFFREKEDQLVLTGLFSKEGQLVLTGSFSKDSIYYAKRRKGGKTRLFFIYGKPENGYYSYRKRDSYKIELNGDTTTPLLPKFAIQDLNQYEASSQEVAGGIEDSSGTQLSKRVRKVRLSIP